MHDLHQLIFSAGRTGDSQCRRILEMLESHRGEWVDMPLLARAGSASENGFCMVHSRVADLRRRGHVISHKNERLGAQCHSFYMLT